MLYLFKWCFKNHFGSTPIFIQSYSGNEVNDAALLCQPVTPSSVFTSTKQEFGEGNCSIHLKTLYVPNWRQSFWTALAFMQLFVYVCSPPYGISFCIYTASVTIICEMLSSCFFLVFNYSVSELINSLENENVTAQCRMHQLMKQDAGQFKGTFPSGKRADPLPSGTQSKNIPLTATRASGLKRFS